MIMIHNNCYGLKWDQVTDCTDCKVNSSCYRVYVKEAKGQVRVSLLIPQEKYQDAITKIKSDNPDIVIARVR